MVYYRKHRPQTIAELDLTFVREKLTTLLTSYVAGSADLPHAFLFTGARGLGKTSTARIFAKAINCTHRKKGQIEPCNACAICKSITNGSHIDIVEIDGASNRGIDEIRSLREKVKYAPVELAKKVYIIDEVHMLTSEAFNALLKTLEEPPAHVIFILCTTESNRLLPTILSRTFIIQFDSPEDEEIKRSLLRVAESEKLTFEGDVIALLIRLSEGSFRDAHKILEEVAIEAGGKAISKDIVERIFKSSALETTAKEILSYLLKKNADAILDLLEKKAASGIDFRSLTKSICTQLQQQLHDSLKKPQKNGFSTSDLTILLDLFMKAYTQLRGAVIPQLPLELACLAWCFEEHMKQQSAVAIPQKEMTEVKVSRTIIPISESSQKVDEEQPSTVILQAQISGSTSDKEFLSELITSIKKANHSIAGLLRSSVVMSVTDSILTLQLPYKFHADKLNEQKTKKVIEEHASLILARPMSVTVVSK